MKRLRRRSKIEDVVHGLRENDAVKTVGGDFRRVGKIRHNCGARMPGDDVQNILFGNACAAETARIGIVTDFKDAATDGLGVFRKERFDVVAIDGQATVEAEMAARGRQASKSSEADAVRCLLPAEETRRSLQRLAWTQPEQPEEAASAR